MLVILAVGELVIEVVAVAITSAADDVVAVVAPGIGVVAEVPADGAVAASFAAPSSGAGRCRGFHALKDAWTIR